MFVSHWNIENRKEKKKVSTIAYDALCVCNINCTSIMYEHELLYQLVKFLKWKIVWHAKCLLVWIESF